MKIWQIKKIKTGFIILLLIIVSGFFCFLGGGKRELKQEEQNTDASLSFKLATRHAGFEERDSQSAFVFQDKMWLIGGLNANDCVYNKRGIDLIADQYRHLFQGKQFDSLSFYVNYNQAKYFNDIWTSIDGIN